MEALIGAGLVLFELVAHDASMKRGLSMILHLGNTFFLLAALSLTAHWLGRRVAVPATVPHAPKPAALALRVAVGASLLSVLVLASSGAIAALGDTLFPARSLGEGLAQDLSPMAHAFLRLRILHPVFALVSGLLVISTSTFARIARPLPRVRRLSRLTTLLFVVQFAAGLVNVTLLAPIPMQIVHLLLADAVWIALVLMGWEAIWGGAQAPIMSRNGPAPSSEVPPSTSSVEPVT
jgi:heme A synthase